MGEYTNPNGVANTLEDISVNLTTILDEVFAQSTKTAMWAPNPALVQGFKNGKTGRIPTISVSGLGDYSPTQGYRQGSASVTFQPYELQYDRGISYLLDEVDVMKDGGVATATSVLSEFSRSNLVPEVDAVRIAKVATKALATTDHFKSGYTPAKSTMFSEILKGLQTIEDDSGYDAGVNILVNTKYADMLKNSTEFNKTKDIESNASVLNNKINAINDCPVTYVPSSRMYSAVDLATGESAYGYTKGTTAVDVVAVLTAPDTAQGIVAHQITNIVPPAINQTADGTRINFRCYHDCIIPVNKAKGIYAITC